MIRRQAAAAIVEAPPPFVLWQDISRSLAVHFQVGWALSSFGNFRWSGRKDQLLARGRRT
jgi:hypothetical protein